MRLLKQTMLRQLKQITLRQQTMLLLQATLHLLLPTLRLLLLPTAHKQEEDANVLANTALESGKHYGARCKQRAIIVSRDEAHPVGRRTVRQRPSNG